VRLRRSVLLVLAASAALLVLWLLRTELAPQDATDVGAGSLAGRVTWSDETPAAAWVRIGSKSRLETVQTDEEGRFRATGLGAGPFLVEASADRYGGSPLEGNRATAVAEEVEVGTGGLELVLDGGTLEVRIVDELGHDIPEYSVEGNRSEGLGSFSRTVRASVDGGIARIVGLRQGEWALRFQAPGHLAPTAGEDGTLHVKVPGDGPLTVVLPRAAIVPGRVLDPEGRPVAGASVRAIRRADPDPFDEPRDTREEAGYGMSDQLGAFRIEGLEPGRTTLIASREGWAQSVAFVLECTGGEERDGIELDLRPGACVAGEVRTPADEPWAGARVFVHTADFAYVARIETDSRGHFALCDAPAEEVCLVMPGPKGPGPKEMEVRQRVTLVAGQRAHVTVRTP